MIAEAMDQPQNQDMPGGFPVVAVQFADEEDEGDAYGAPAPEAHNAEEAAHASEDSEEDSEEEEVAVSSRLRSKSSRAYHCLNAADASADDQEYYESILG